MSTTRVNGAAEPAAAADVEALRQRLEEAEETLRAIRHGDVDALVVADGGSERVYTLRSADAPYRALVEQMQEGAAALDLAGIVVYCNQRFAELVSQPMESVIGAPVDGFVERADRLVLQRLVAAGSGKLRTRIPQRDDPPRDAQIAISTVMLDGVEHRTMVVTDITSLVKAQRESRSKDEFLAMLAHELRNPLGAMSGAIEVLRLAELTDARGIRARDVLVRQVSHVARLVDDLLDVGRVVTGKIVLETAPVDWAEIVLASVAAMAAHRGMQPRVDVSATPVWALADPVRLEQITNNLLANALKFTPADRAIRVFVGPEQGRAVLRVADEGIGIDSELLPKIFDLFVQGDASGDRARGGLGLGLTLVRQLVELHGGTVEALSPGRNQGATFEVRIPAIPAPAGDMHHRRSDAALAPQRVLIIDDHDDAREMCRLALEARGHEVFAAADGPEGLHLLRSARPDVAIVDIGLPGMDGYEVAQHMRADPAGRDILLIALTGYGFPEDRARTRDAGFDRHLVKPTPPQDLLREVESLRR